MADEEREGGQVVPDRPQIIVELVNKVDMEISVARIGDDFATVETTTIVIPADCAKAVAKAMLALLKK